jgi:hypothetical protein
MAHGCNTGESHYSELSHGTAVVCNYGQIHYVIAEILIEYLHILVGQWKGVHNGVAEKSTASFISEVCKAYSDPPSLPPICTGTISVTK